MRPQSRGIIDGNNKHRPFVVNNRCFRYKNFLVANIDSLANHLELVLFVQYGDDAARIFCGRFLPVLCNYSYPVSILEVYFL